MRRLYKPYEEEWLKNNSHNYTLEEIAERLGRTTAGVIKKLRTLSLTYKYKTPEYYLTSQEKERIVGLHISGKTPIQIAELTGRSNYTIHKYLDKHFASKRYNIKRLTPNRNKQQYYETEADIEQSLNPIYKAEELTGWELETLNKGI